MPAVLFGAIAALTLESNSASPAEALSRTGVDLGAHPWTLLAQIGALVPTSVNMNTDRLRDRLDEAWRAHGTTPAPGRFVARLGSDPYFNAVNCDSATSPAHTYPGLLVSRTYERRDGTRLIDHAAIQAKFVADLGGLAAPTTAIGEQPLEASSVPPLPHKLRVYTYNATNPPGGRSRPEHKIQLIVPGQVRGSTGEFDHSGDRAVVLAGYADDAGVWILWDASKHHHFSYSKNAQVPTEVVERAAALQSVQLHERTLGSGETEVILVAPPAYLVEALTRRFEVAPGGVPPSVSPTPHPGPPAGIVVAPAALPRGKPYVVPTVVAGSGVKVFEVDPDLIDRGTNAHIDTQNALGDAVVAAGLVPLSPATSDPQFDVAWMDGDIAIVAEVKSLTALNEERQLRLGLGQVLRYRHDLAWDAVASVQAVLAVERAPNDPRWIGVCEENGVALVWPATFARLF